MGMSGCRMVWVIRGSLVQRPLLTLVWVFPIPLRIKSFPPFFFDWSSFLFKFIITDFFFFLPLLDFKETITVNYHEVYLFKLFSPFHAYEENIKKKRKKKKNGKKTEFWFRERRISCIVDMRRKKIFTCLRLYRKNLIFILGRNRESGIHVTSPILVFPAGPRGDHRSPHTTAADAPFPRHAQRTFAPRYSSHCRNFSLCDTFSSGFRC